MQTEKININFLGTEFLEICSRELLRRINKENSSNREKEEIIKEFISNFAEDTAVMIINNTDTDDHLDEIMEATKEDISFVERRKMFLAYVKDFDEKMEDLISIYIDGFKKKYSN